MSSELSELDEGIDDVLTEAIDDVIDELIVVLDHGDFNAMITV